MRKLEGSDVRVGDKILYRIRADGYGNGTYHVRGFVDDRIVIRKWFRRWNTWKYEVLEPAFLLVNREYLFLVRSKPTK